MGFKIAATGLVVFVFFLFVASLAKEEPRQEGPYRVAGILMLLGFIAIPVGLIVGIWDN